VLRVESQLARTELLLASSKNLASVTEKQLRVSMHDPNPGSYAIGEDIRNELAVIALNDNDELFQTALSKRPEAERLREAATAQRLQGAAYRAGYLPRVDLSGNAYYANPNQRVFPTTKEFKASWDVSAQMSWALDEIPGALAARRGADARALALDDEERALGDRIAIEVTQAIQDVRQADLAVNTAKRGLESAEESYRVRRLLFQNGRATSTELLDAETDLTRARLEALDARIDVRVARVRLTYALGEDVGAPAAR
jgi:outer membrane protein TolC